MPAFETGKPGASPGFFTREGVYRMLEGTPTHPLRRTVRLGLAVLIVLNVLAVIAESVPELAARHGGTFQAFEWFSVVVFSIEYLLRIWVCPLDPRYRGLAGRLRYAVSPMALVDLLAIVPSFLGALVQVDTRMLRALRLLRIFKLSRHSSSMDLLLTVLRKEAGSVLSAMFVMMIVILIAASGIYVIEREAQPQAFDSIPKAMWWAAVTLTTVGYGDVVPITTLGRIFGLLITVAGVGMVALPAGILASGFSLELQRRREAFRLQVRRALEDGAVTRGEAEGLEDQAEALGLSPEEAQMVRAAEAAEKPASAQRCPHCGRLP